MIKNEIVQILCKQEIPHTTFRVLLYLLSRQGKNEYTWPGIRTIAKDCSMSVQSVLTSINELERKNFVVKYTQKNHKNTKHRSNHYVVQPIKIIQEKTILPTQKTKSDVLKFSTTSCQNLVHHVLKFSTTSCQNLVRDLNTDQLIHINNTKKMKINFSFLKNHDVQYYKKMKPYFTGMKNTIYCMSYTLEKITHFRKTIKMDFQKELQQFVEHYFIRTLQEKFNIRFYIKLNCLVRCFNTYMTYCISTEKNYTNYPDYLKYHPRVQSIQEFIDKEKQLESFYLQYTEIYKCADEFKNPGLSRHLKTYAN